MKCRCGGRKSDIDAFKNEMSKTNLMIDDKEKKFEAIDNIHNLLLKEFQRSLIEFKMSFLISFNFLEDIKRKPLSLDY